MPNHVKNIVKFVGEPLEVSNIIEHLKGEPFDDGTPRLVDFNRIIPIPDGMDVQIHSGVENAVKNALKMPLHENSLIAMLESGNREKTPSPLEFKDEDWAHFIQCLQNVRKHGSIYWHDWCNKHWDTKWNAYSIETEGDDTLIFETAWSAPITLMGILSGLFPNVTIEHTYADEDTGSNAGIIHYNAGKETMVNQPPSQSIEAYDIAFTVRPHYKEDYELVNGSYQYVDSE